MGRTNEGEVRGVFVAMVAMELEGRNAATNTDVVVVVVVTDAVTIMTNNETTNELIGRYRTIMLFLLVYVLLNHLYI